MKKAFLSREQAESICAQYPTPFHIYDEAGFVANARAVLQAFAWNKGFREYFAVKATPNPAILSLLLREGCGFDCSSMTELMLAKAVGAKAEQIMFSSNDTPAEEFVYCRDMGGIINFDDITLIDYAEEALGSLPETVSCRYNPGGVFKLSNGIMDNPGDAKYGMTRDHLFEAFRMLQAKGVKHLGIHAFLASNTVTNDYYPELAAQLFQLAVELSKETGADIRFINLSGGVGIPYRPEETANDIAVIGAGVRERFEQIMVPAGLSDVAIYTEMGRFMLAPYGALVTRAIHEKHIYKEYIGVDACAVNLMRPAMYGSYHHITVLGKETAPADHSYDVVGSLCENNDKFAIDRALPEIGMGDLLFIHDTGAHGFSMGYNYNGKLRSAELLLHQDGSVEQIRRAEQPMDYFATLDGLPVYETLRQLVASREIT
ncbi:MAG: diaminopimelate decarboxylase [Butyrivibrio sp.]|nr:diaminopimelate decarboxylase [Butyrivibrio sp.]